MKNERARARARKRKEEEKGRNGKERTNLQTFTLNEINF